MLRTGYRCCLCSVGARSSELAQLWTDDLFQDSTGGVPADANLSHRTDPIVSQGWKPQAQACGLWMSLV